MSRRATALIMAAFVCVFVGLALAIHELQSTANDTNAIVRKDLAASEARNAALTYVLDEQATPYLIYVATQLQELGGSPPRILLGPQHPTFAEQLEAQGLTPGG